jgi:CubicO group peptidase (beta-lactamase class C family)
MQLVESGTLQLDAPVTDYLTDLEKPISRSVTLRNLLSSTSGLPALDDTVFWSTTDERLGSPRLVARQFIGGDLLFEPGKQFSYNNADFILLGAVLEQVTGKSYEHLLHEKILMPLDMKQTGVLRQDKITKKLASGYIKHDAEVLHEPYYHIQNFSSAGAMYSTVGDLLTWNTALLTYQMLSKPYQDEMFTPLPNLGFVALGSWVYPLKLRDGKQVKIIERQGNIGGFCALNQLLPESGHSLIFLSNVEAQTLFSTYMGKGLSYDVLNALAF